MASAVPDAAVFKFAVEFECRPDGGLRAFSNDVPGFVLSNRDCDVVLEGVVPILETILSEMFSARVVVKPVRDMREMLESSGVIERKRAPAPRHRKSAPAAPPSRREYVTELAA